ncbi:MAG: hypothetical protein K2F90_01500 [Clostridiales bacterium]|nr:hypothetical protein [Clostridiales bacterium]
MDNAEYTCKDCFLQRSGDCFGKLTVCNRFEYAPAPTERINYYPDDGSEMTERIRDRTPDWHDKL